MLEQLDGRGFDGSSSFYVAPGEMAFSHTPLSAGCWSTSREEALLELNSLLLEAAARYG